MGLQYRKGGAASCHTDGEFLSHRLHGSHRFPAASDGAAALQAAEMLHATQI